PPYALEPKPKGPMVTRHTLTEDKKRKTRILIVEDNVVNQKVVQRILEKHGYRADIASNGKEAVELLNHLPYDIVFMDVQMPEMDGFEATKSIRSLSSNLLNRDVPIIAMTAHAFKEDRDQCLNAGMNDYIAKPINPKSLTAMISKWSEAADGRNAETR
ncbi:MAG: response regulator, partial [Thermodesulfobacteriota bacterium]